jgi:hypothetical protein
LNCTDRANVPVDCNTDSDESSVAEDEELAPDVVGRLSLVEGTTERCGAVGSSSGTSRTMADMR